MDRNERQNSYKNVVNSRGNSREIRNLKRSVNVLSILTGVLLVAVIILTVLVILSFRKTPPTPEPQPTAETVPTPTPEPPETPEPATNAPDQNGSEGEAGGEKKEQGTEASTPEATPAPATPTPAPTPAPAASKIITQSEGFKEETLNEGGTMPQGTYGDAVSAMNDIKNVDYRVSKKANGLFETTVKGGDLPAAYLEQSGDVPVNSAYLGDLFIAGAAYRLLTINRIDYTLNDFITNLIRDMLSKEINETAYTHSRNLLLYLIGKGAEPLTAETINRDQWDDQVKTIPTEEELTEDVISAGLDFINGDLFIKYHFDPGRSTNIARDSKDSTVSLFHVLEYMAYLNPGAAEGSSVWGQNKAYENITKLFGISPDAADEGIVIPFKNVAGEENVYMIRTSDLAEQGEGEYSIILAGKGEEQMIFELYEDPSGHGKFDDRMENLLKKELPSTNGQNQNDVAGENTGDGSQGDVQPAVDDAAADGGELQNQEDGLIEEQNNGNND